MSDSNFHQELEALKQQANSMQACLAQETSLRMAYEAIITSKIGALEYQVIRWQQAFEARP